MREVRLKIAISRSPEEVIAWALDPQNTPKWIDALTEEQTNEWPPKVGTIYRNQHSAGEWSEYELTDLNPAEGFTMAQRGSTYKVVYSVRLLGENSCELEYVESVDEGDLAEPFTMVELEKLKEAIEGDE